MVLSTVTVSSGISVATRNLLLSSGHLTTSPTRPDRYLLRDLFLRLFLAIHVDLPALQLTLVDP
jgi:hypothetical protein